MKRNCENCGSDIPPAMLRCRECGHRGIRTEGTIQHKQPETSQSISKNAEAGELNKMLALAESLDDAEQIESDTQLDHQSHTDEFPVTKLPQATHHSTSPLTSGVIVGQEHASNKSSGTTLEVGLQNDNPTAEKAAHDSNRLKATCTTCHKQIETARKLAGMSVRCPQCGETVQLPLLQNSESNDPQSHTESLQQYIEASLKLPSDIRQNTTPATTLSAKDLKKLESTIRNSLQDKSAFEALTAKGVKAVLNAFDKIGETRNQELAGFLLEKLQNIPEIFQAQALQAIAAAQLHNAYEAVIVYLDKKSHISHDDLFKMLVELQDARAIRPLIYAYQIMKSLRPKICVVVSSFKDRAIQPLLEVIKENHGNQLQAIALHLLEPLHPVEAVDVLTQVVNDSNLQHRRLAGRTLRRIQDIGALPALHRMLSDRDETLRIYASQGLILNANSKNIRVLSEALLDQNEKVQFNAITALATINDPSVIPVLSQMMKHPSVEIQLATIDALGKLKSKEVVPQLLDLLEENGNQTEHSRLVRQIVDALKRIRDPRCALPLIELLETQDIGIKKSAIEALGVLKDCSARLPLEEILEHYWREEIKAVAAKALGVLGDPASIPVLEDALNGADHVRIQAVIALGNFKDPQTIPAIRKRLSDPLHQVRYQAARVVGEMGDKESISQLEKLVIDPDEMVQRAAIKSLAALGSERTENEIRCSLKKEKRIHKIRKQLSIPMSLILGLGASIPGGLYALIGGSSVMILLVGFIFLYGTGTSGAQPLATVSGYVGMVDLSEDGNLLAVARTKGMFEIWDVQTHTLISVENHLPKSKDIVFSKNLNTLVIATGQGIAFADVSNSGDIGQPTQPTKDEGVILKLCANEDKTFAASCDSKGVCRRWDISKRTSDLAIALDAAPSAISLNSSGSLLAVGATDGKITIFDWKTSEALLEHVVPVRKGQPRTGDVRSIAFSPDGMHIAISTQSGVLQIVNFDSGKSISLIDNGPFTSIIEFGNDQTLWGVSNNLWRMADIKSGQIEMITQDLGMMTAHSFCREKMIFAGGSDEKKPVFVVNVTTNKTTQLLDE